MISFKKKTEVAEEEPVAPIVKAEKPPVRNDDATRRKVADTDGTARRMRQVVEDNRLI